MFRLHTFNDIKFTYIQRLTTKSTKELQYYFDVFTHFSEHWSLDELDFLHVFEQSFKSNISVRLWKRDDFYPKEMMLQFIQRDREFVRQMFRDLFQDQKDLQLRVNRFIYHCDILLQEIKRDSKKIYDHYHSNLEMISLYLSFNRPQMYAPFQKNLMLPYLKRLESIKSPPMETFEQYQKILKTTGILLAKDSDLTSKLNQIYGLEHCLEKAPSLVAFDFAKYTIR